MSRQQIEFSTSNCLFNLFVGGRNSGKTTAACFRALTKASQEPKRHFLIVSPAQKMNDQNVASMILLPLAREMGIVRGFKKGPPSELVLKNRSVIILDSAENLGHLRGLTLSGIVVDEAQELTEDILIVGAPCLREGGNGWMALTATPPKAGRSHWLFEKFCTGKSNVGYWHSTFRDNPSSSANWDEPSRAMMDSLQAAAELDGEWIDPAGCLFRREWLQIIDHLPPLVEKIRAWDLAATAQSQNNRDPDFTCGALLGKSEDGDVYVCDLVRMRGSPRHVEQTIRCVAEQDGIETTIWVEQEGGASGKFLSEHFARLLLGFSFHSQRPTRDKRTRAGPLASAVERGTVKFLRRPWLRDLIDEFIAFDGSGKGHDDIVDASSLAFERITSGRRLWLGRIVGDRRNLLG
jgi:predicted phage terminase large subunit-like protein